MSRRAAVGLALLVAAGALAASRPRYGGTLRVVSAAPHADADPRLNDTANDAPLMPLRTQPLCREKPDGRLQWTGAEVTSSTPKRWTLRPLRTLQWTTGAPVTAAELAQSLSRLASADARSPYRALLQPLRGEGRRLAATGDRIELVLSHPWPDLERTLCHLALAPWRSGVGVAPFVQREQAWAAFTGFARGRPFVDRLELTVADARRGGRLLELGQGEVFLGGELADGAAEASGVPTPFATYLVLNPRRAPAELLAQVDAGIDRRDLVRYFVPGPAAPMTRLLQVDAAVPTVPARPPGPPPGPPRELSLLYDESIPEHRAVAERLQVRLHGMGFRLAPQAVSRTVLRSRWAAQQFDVALFNVLLPTAPGPALAVVLELAGRRDLLASELPLIGAVADQAARDGFARARADALQPRLPLVPLYARGVRAQAPRLGALPLDAYGLPQLEDLVLEGLPALPPAGASGAPR